MKINHILHKRDISIYFSLGGVSFIDDITKHSYGLHYYLDKVGLSARDIADIIDLEHIIKNMVRVKCGCTILPLKRDTKSF